MSRSFLKKHALYLAWVITLIGFFNSIFYGEVLHNDPCNLCWYQRIALFPLVLLLGMALYRSEPWIIPYAAPFSIFGILVSLFQILKPYVPLLQKASTCGIQEPCIESQFIFFGFLSFPEFSCLGFVLITFLLLYGRKSSVMYS